MFNPTNMFPLLFQLEEKIEEVKEENMEKAIETGQRKRRFVSGKNDMPDINLVTKVPADAQYLLMIGILFLDDDSSAKLEIEFKGPLGYLSAMEYPLLTFYMVRLILSCAFITVCFRQ